MSKLKSFEQFVTERDRSEEIEQDHVEQGTPDVKDVEDVKDEVEEVQADQEVAEATVVMDAVDPKSKSLLKFLKKHNVSMEVINQEGPSGFPEVELTGDRSDLEKVLADGKHGWDDPGLAEYIEESEDTFKVKVKSLNEEESEEVEETESKSLAEMLTELYESSCKNEAKAYEGDAHDEHTIESYMKENAALVAALAAKSLKEMKEDCTIEAYEAACNEMIESYSKKMNEMKEMDSAEGVEEETSEE